MKKIIKFFSITPLVLLSTTSLTLCGCNKKVDEKDFYEKQNDELRKELKIVRDIVEQQLKKNRQYRPNE